MNQLRSTTGTVGSRVRAVLLTVALALGVTLLSPLSPAQAIGGHPVQNTCAGTGESLLGYRNINGSTQLVQINCGATQSDLYQVVGGTFRVQKANSSFSVCYSSGAAQITYSSRAWTVRSC